MAVRRPLRVRYIPATTQGQHNRARARYGIPPTSDEGMDKFLLSAQLADPVLKVAKVIALNARTLAAMLLYSEERSHAYEQSIEADMQEPVLVNGHARVRAAVHAHGGFAHWSGPIGEETSHAAVVEFDVPAGSEERAWPRPAEGRRILGRAGEPFGLWGKGE